MRRELDRIRLANLARLIAEAGSADALARRTGASGPYISQIRSGLPYKTGRRRRVGDRLAATLERGMDKPHGWMDAPAPTCALAGTADWSTGTGYPVISWEQAGAWTDAPDFPGAEAHMPCPVRTSADAFVVRATGRSMAPRFRPGDFVFVDPEVAPASDRIVVVRHPDAGTASLRQLLEEDRRRYLRALNPDWPDRIVQMDDNAVLCGVAVFQGRLL